MQTTKLVFARPLAHIARMASPQKSHIGLPSRQQILDFLSSADDTVGKREIGKHFGLKGHEKIQLKSLLKDMAEEGLIDGNRSAFHRMGGVPKVTVLRVVDIEEGEAIAIPESWQPDDAVPPPRLRIIEKKKGPGRHAALRVGNRVLARTEEAGAGWRAFVMKVLPVTEQAMLGVIELDASGQAWLAPVDKRVRNAAKVVDRGNAEVGQLVLTEAVGRGARAGVKVIEVLGDPLAPRAFSLIAIHKFGIPFVFPDNVVNEAQVNSSLSLSETKREDLRALPIIAIDPADARDHDDAIWAEPDGAGGFRAVVTIADVSFYVRPGSALDREARKRGNSVYFPDRVVPMLPEVLSAEICSLKEGEPRAAMACHLAIDAEGRVTSFRFTRALVQIAKVIAYEDAQALIDGLGKKPPPLQGRGLGEGTLLPEQTQLNPDSPHPNPVSGRPVPRTGLELPGAVQPETPEGEGLLRESLKNLWDAWHLLAKARAARDPLELELPERRVMLDEAGKITEIAVRERLDAHRVVEDFMIAANVAAAKALESKAHPVVYRIHEPPTREKLLAMKDYFKSIGQNLALGQVITPGLFNRMIKDVADPGEKALVMEAVLRSQTQAFYGPQNAGHFGLALGSYAHFTSPIRRYSDLLVHRALVDAFGLEQPAPGGDVPAHSGLSDSDRADLGKVSDAISLTERRAMEAERDTTDRYVAAWLSGRVGEVFPTRITGVRGFGFFATIVGLGGDGLVPVSTLGRDYYEFDEGAHALVGQSSGVRYTVGDLLDLRLGEANPLTGALKFELPEGGGTRVEPRGNRPERGPRRDAKGKHPVGPRGRPGNIRHQGRGK